MSKDKDLEQTQEIPVKKKHYGRKILIVLLVIVAAFVGCLIYGSNVDEEIEATKKYNSAINEYNSVVSEYNSLADQACLDNLDGFVSHADELPTVATDSDSVFESVLSGNDAEKITEDTKTLRKMKETLISNEEVIKQLINPNEDWVKEKLSNISDIINIKAVTEDNDPNGLLNKEGGYTSSTYFTLKDISDENVDPVEAGTDGGGCIEVYETLADAEARVDYLKEFDNSYMYTGAYALIGTSVVRVTYALEEEQQYELMDKIFRILSEI